MYTAFVLAVSQRKGPEFFRLGVSFENQSDHHTSAREITPKEVFHSTSFALLVQNMVTTHADLGWA